MTTYIVEVAIEVEAESREYAESLISDIELDESINDITITCVTEKRDHQPNRGGGYREPAKTNWLNKTPAQVWLDRAKIRLEEARLRAVENTKESILLFIFMKIEEDKGKMEFPIEVRIGLLQNVEEAISELNSEGWSIRKAYEGGMAYTVNLKE